MVQKRPHKPQFSRKYRQVIPGYLREMREKAGLSQRELAERLGCPQITVHRVEVNTRRVDVAELYVWAEACGVKPRKAFLAVLAEFESH